MITVSLPVFRSYQDEFMAAAQQEPVQITSRGGRRRAVLVSPEFFDRAVETLENEADIEAAERARREDGRVSFQELVDELGT